MKDLSKNPLGRLLAILFSLLLLGSGWMPSSALAIKHISLDGGGPDSTDGDPLDSNDYSSGSGLGDGSHDNLEENAALIPSDSFGVFRFPVGDLKLLVVFDLQTGMPVFQILSIRDIKAPAEASDVR